MNLLSSYKGLQDEVATFRNLVRKAISQNPDAEQLYKGCAIMYSSIVEAPPFLFIGINPGAGRYNETGKKIEDDDLEPCDGFEYTNALVDNYDYALAKQTRTLFEYAGMLHCLEKSVKTNVYYFATKNEPELWKLFSLLGADINRQFHEYAFMWTRQMIEMIKPQVIICEGMQSFNKLSEIYNVSQNRAGSYGYLELPDKTPVVGYSRRYSNIKDKVIVADYLKLSQWPIRNP